MEINDHGPQVFVWQSTGIILPGSDSPDWLAVRHRVTIRATGLRITTYQADFMSLSVQLFIT